jgi:large subunit ribosomal protein L4
LRSALSLHAERGSIAVVDAAAFDAPKTRQARELLAGWDQPQPTLIVLGAEESNAALSFRNLTRVAVLTPENVGVADVVGAASLLVSQAALDALTARVAAPPKGETVPAKGESEAPSKSAAPAAAGASASEAGASEPVQAAVPEVPEEAA